MAGDWIKMRTNLWDDPRVAAVCDRLDIHEATAVGALYRLWAIADEHSEDGTLPAITAASLDRKVGVKGFAEAVESVGWLSIDDGFIAIERFEEHNGKSAKRRSLDAQRKGSARKADKSRTNCGQSAPKCGTRPKPSTKPKPKVIDSSNEESSVESSSAKPVSVVKQAEQLYAAYPRKVARDAALKAIANALKRPDVEFEMLLAAVSEYAKSREGKDPNLTPYPATWFNAGRWEDDRAEWFRDERNNNSRERAREPWEHLPATSTTEGPRTF